LGVDKKAWRETGAWRRVVVCQAVTDSVGRLAVWWSPPGGDGVVMILQVRGT